MTKATTRLRHAMRHAFPIEGSRVQNVRLRDHIRDIDVTAQCLDWPIPRAGEPTNYQWKLAAMRLHAGAGLSAVEYKVAFGTTL